MSNLRTDHLSVGSRFMKVFAEHYFALAIMGNLKGGLSPLSLGIKGFNARYRCKFNRRGRKSKHLSLNSLKSDSIENVAPVSK